MFLKNYFIIGRNLLASFLIQEISIIFLLKMNGKVTKTLSNAYFYTPKHILLYTYIDKELKYIYILDCLQVLAKNKKYLFFLEGWFFSMDHRMEIFIFLCKWAM